MVAGRDNATGNYEDVLPFEFSKFRNQLWQKGFMPSGKAGDPHSVNIIFNGMPGYLLRGLKQRPDVDIEAHVGKTCSDNLCATVVSVLAQFGNEYPRPAPFTGGKIV